MQFLHVTPRYKDTQVFDVCTNMQWLNTKYEKHKMFNLPLYFDPRFLPKSRTVGLCVANWWHWWFLVARNHFLQRSTLHLLLTPTNSLNEIMLVFACTIRQRREPPCSILREEVLTLFYFILNNSRKLWKLGDKMSLFRQMSFWWHCVWKSEKVNYSPTDNNFEGSKEHIQGTLREQSPH